MNTMEQFIKDLRAGIKSGRWSNERIHRHFNETVVNAYKTGYADAIRDLNKRVQEAENANQVADSSNNVDGVGIQSGSLEREGSYGTHADHADYVVRLGESLQASDIESLHGSDSQHPVFDSTVGGIVGDRT